MRLAHKKVDGSRAGYDDFICVLRPVQCKTSNSLSHAFNFNTSSNFKLKYDFVCGFQAAFDYITEEGW
jgi:hypothetical protein